MPVERAEGDVVLEGPQALAAVLGELLGADNAFGTAIIIHGRRAVVFYFTIAVRALLVTGDAVGQKDALAGGDVGRADLAVLIGQAKFVKEVGTAMAPFQQAFLHVGTDVARLSRAALAAKVDLVVFVAAEATEIDRVGVGGIPGQLAEQQGLLERSGETAGRGRRDRRGYVGAKTTSVDGLAVSLTSPDT